MLAIFVLKVHTPQLSTTTTTKVTLRTKKLKDGKPRNKFEGRRNVDRSYKDATTNNI